MPDIKEGRFEVFWSQEDEEWVARHTAYPSMSWLDPLPHRALHSLHAAIRYDQDLQDGRYD